MHHRRPAAPHSHRPNHRQINRLMPFTTAPLFHALQLLETGDSARFHMPGHKGEPVFNTYADIFAIDFTETYGTGNLYTGEGPIRDAEVAAARYFGAEDCFFLTGGSTQGILAMLGTAVGRGGAGLLAVTYTDIVQMALLLLGVVFLAVPLVGSMLHKNGMSLAADLPASFFDLGAWGWPTIAALGLSTVMSFFTSMDSYTRCIAAKDAKTARTGTIYAAVLVLIIAGASTFLGMAGKLILPDLASSNNVIAALVVELFPHGLKGLVLIGVLSAIMSTADISVLTGSASLTKDIYQRYFHPEASEKTLMRVGLAASLFVGVLGAVFGWFTQDIMNILLITFTINSAGLFLPTIGAFFWKKSCSAGAFASMLSATIIAVVWFIGGKVSALPLFSIDALWPSFGVSAVLYVVICLAHRQTPEEQEQAERFYAAR